ncbi:MAG: hypothetical protein IJN69_01235 [Oscillospiraceae bacterium]|nr:hypothetical protein [Oscillospiraceae bacterium]
MKKVDFLFIYEVRNRELENICLLAAELEKRGYTTAFINSWHACSNPEEDYDAEVVVVSACYSSNTYKFFTNFATKFRKVVNMQWEQILHNGYVESEGTTSWDFWGESLKTRHICWGENTKNRLMTKFGVPEEFLNVCGCIPLDFYRPEFRSRIIPKDKLFADNGLDTAKTTMLFISSFSYTSLPLNTRPKSSVDFSDVHAKSVIDSQKAIADWMEKACKEFPDIQFIYRAHPAEAEADFLLQLAKENKNFFCLSKEPIKHWIMACDKIYNWTSTAAAEVYVSGKQSFVLEPVPLDHRVTYRLFENGNSIKTYDGFRESLQLPSDAFAQPIDDGLMNECYNQTDVPNYKRVADCMEETFHSTTYKSENFNEYSSQQDRYEFEAKYTNFWRSPLNVLWCKIAKVTNIQHPSFKYRRENGLFSMKEVRKLEEYYRSRTEKNYLSDEEIHKIVDSFKELI